MIVCSRGAVEQLLEHAEAHGPDRSTVRILCSVITQLEGPLRDRAAAVVARA